MHNVKWWLEWLAEYTGKLPKWERSQHYTYITMTLTFDTKIERCYPFFIHLQIKYDNSTFHFYNIKDVWNRFLSWNLFTMSSVHFCTEFFNATNNSEKVSSNLYGWNILYYFQTSLFFQNWHLYFFTFSTLMIDMHSTDEYICTSKVR